MQPLIGITTHPKSAPDRAVLDQLLEMIIASVERANGLPMIIPLGRPATPQDAAGPIFFLCSPWSNFVHGQVLTASGGQTTSMT